MAAKVFLDASQMAGVQAQLDSLAADVSREVRRKAMPKATELTRLDAVASAPKGKPSDRAKQSKKHKTKWDKTPPLHTVVIGVIRDYSEHEFTSFVGVQHPWGNKAYFDYHGKKNRTVKFWGANPTSSPKSRKKVRWMVGVADRVGPQVVQIIQAEIDLAVKTHMQKK